MFPGYYEASPPVTVVLHMGGSTDSYLLAPRIQGPLNNASDSFCLAPVETLR
jgi:hypothetical protein